MVHRFQPRSLSPQPVHRLLTVVVLLCGGCDLPDRPDIATFRETAPWEPSLAEQSLEVSTAARPGLASLVRVTEPPPPFPVDWQTCELRFVKEQVVGTSKIVSQATKDGQILVSVNQRTLRQQNSVRWLESTEQRMLHEADGRLRRIDSRWRNGPMRREQVLRIEEDSAEFENRFSGTSVAARLALPNQIASPLIVYQTILRQSMTASERRDFDVLVPIIARLAHLQIEATGPAAVSGLIPSDKPLHEIRVLSQIDQQPVRTMFHWHDDDGQIVKSNVAGERDSTFRCTPEQYLSMGGDILNQTHPLSVTVSGKPFAPGSVQRVGFEIMHPQPTPSSSPSDTSSPDFVSPAPGQYVQRLDSQRLRVIVSNDALPTEKVVGRFESYEQRPTEQDTAATAILNFNSPEVQRLQKNLAFDGLLADELAVEANRLVHSLLEYQPLSDGIRTASQVASSSIADSTEQAILLMALLRGKNIPCRLLVGIRRDDAGLPPSSLSSDEMPFAYHSWVIAWAKDKWITLDPVDGDDRGADRLALQTADLQSPNPEVWMRTYLNSLVPLRIKVFAAVPK